MKDALTSKQLDHRYNTLCKALLVSYEVVVISKENPSQTSEQTRQELVLEVQATSRGTMDITSIKAVEPLALDWNQGGGTEART